VGGGECIKYLLAVLIFFSFLVFLYFAQKLVPKCCWQGYMGSDCSPDFRNSGLRMTWKFERSSKLHMRVPCFLYLEKLEDMLGATESEGHQRHDCVPC
jgi:hypothetical protein